MRITFAHTIDTSVSADELWDLLVDSFENSATSPLWPSELESLRCDELAEGARVDATYHIGPIDAPQHYTIPAFDAERRTFTYRTGPDHPLDGGGEVSASQTDGGSWLQWSGEYRLRNLVRGLGAAAFIKGWFERRFFGRLEDNLRAIEGSR